MPRVLWSLVVVVLVGCALADVPLGCGGFVRLAPTLSAAQSNADLSKVTVRLLQDGVAKFATECSPTGYFFVPAYDSGLYEVAVDAAGWVVAQSTRTVSISHTAECDAGEFLITGFRIHGTVSLPPACSSIIDMPLFNTSVLQLHQEGHDVIASVSTDAAGRFEFIATAPGKYEIMAAAGSGLAFEPATFVFDATPASDTGIARIPANSIALVGHSIAGIVVAPDGTPVAGVDLALHSNADAKTPLRGCGDDAVCAAASGNDGKFMITRVPCGKYALVPHYHSGEAEFDVEPASLTVQVPSTYAASIMQPFVVVGFSASGRVLGADGVGIANVAITLGKDSSPIATTATDGSYRLEKLRSGTYDIVASLPHVHFAPLRGVKLSPTAATIPDIVAQRYDICGRVSPSPATISITDATAKSVSINTDSNGAFCHAALPSTTYTLAASSPSSNVRFIPESRTVAVVSAAVLEADFSRELHSIHGLVIAKQPSDCGSLSVSLSPAVTPAVSVSSTDCSFAFPPIAPGEYSVSISAPGWCLESSTLTAVAQRDFIPIKFVQTGFSMVVRSSHAVDVVATHISTGKQLTAHAPTTVCLPESGHYRVVPAKDVPFLFDAAEYLFDTSNINNNAVVFTARKFSVSSAIIGSLPAAGSLTVRADIFAADGTTLVHSSNADVSAKGAFSTWVEPGQSVVFTPSAPSPAMFYPQKREGRIPADHSAMPLVLEPIACRPGKFISGTTDPATAGVRVTVADHATSEPVATVETDASGAFSVGPLRDDREYDELFFAPGLAFERDAKQPNIVHALRLAALTAVVRDAQTGSPLAGVLVSVSGSNGYHSNGVTAIDGTLSTSRIVPGDYFARPMLAEYVFKPVHASVHVNEGESPVMEFAGERVAFSVRGRVVAIDGSSLTRTIVTAIPVDTKNQQQQQATVGDDGTYRVRGLVPGESYSITVAKTSLLHVSPASHNILVGHADVTNVDFLAVPITPTSAVCRVRVRVNVSADVLPTLEASLSGPLGLPDDTVRRTKLGIASFAEFGAVSMGMYELRLTTSLAPQHFTCRAIPAVTSIELTAAKCDVRTEVAFSCDKQLYQTASEVPKEKTSVLSLVALIVILVIAANAQAIWLMAKTAWKRMRGQEVRQTRPAPEEIARSYLPKSILAQQHKQQQKTRAIPN